MKKVIVVAAADGEGGVGVDAAELMSMMMMLV